MCVPDGKSHANATSITSFVRHCNNCMHLLRASSYTGVASQRRLILFTSSHCHEDNFTMGEYYHAGYQTNSTYIRRAIGDYDICSVKLRQEVLPYCMRESRSTWMFLGVSFRLDGRNVSTNLISSAKK
jgi:hypothetical protein